MRNLLSTALLLLAAVNTQAIELPTMGWSSWNTYHVNISDR